MVSQFSFYLVSMIHANVLIALPELQDDPTSSRWYISVSVQVLTFSREMNFIKIQPLIKLLDQDKTLP